LVSLEYVNAFLFLKIIKQVKIIHDEILTKRHPASPSTAQYISVGRMIDQTFDLIGYTGAYLASLG